VAERITERASRLADLSVFADCFPADLYPVATELEPVCATAGEVLVRQGDPADIFLIIDRGRVHVHHEGAEGFSFDAEVGEGHIVGELALLRESPRSATVTAVEDLHGWVGGRQTFEGLIELPGVLRSLIRTARQRLAAFITPVPVRLRDGTELLLRPVLPGDSAQAAEGHVEFSSETLYRRFMTSRTPTPALMDYLFEVDYVNHFVWVMIDPAEGADHIVADARFVRDEADPTLAEIAFIVGDDYQGKGVGSFLMKALAVAASTDGVEKFSARVLSDNLAMRAILDGFGAHWEREDVGVVTTVIEVPDHRDVHLPRQLTEQIRVTARKAIEAVR
jgi:protein lysine acetyltransferase